MMVFPPLWGNNFSQAANYFHCRNNRYSLKCLLWTDDCPHLFPPRSVALWATNPAVLISQQGGRQLCPPKYAFWQVLSVARRKLVWNPPYWDLNPRAFPHKWQNLEPCRSPPCASVSSFVMEVRGIHTGCRDRLPFREWKVYCVSCQECCHLPDFSCQSLWGCLSWEKS